MTIKTKIRIFVEELTGYKILKALPHGFDPIADINRVMKNKPMGLFFDVGAHIGQSAKYIASIYPRAQIHCFEPMAHTFKQLTTNTIGLKCKLHNIALGSKQGTVDIAPHQHGDQSGMNSLLHNAAATKSGSSETVRVTTVDEFCKSANIDHIDYLKIDTEGFDLEVIKGAIGMLRSSSIDFVEAEVSMNPTNTYHVSGDLVKKTMEDLGYVLFGLYDQTFEWIVRKPILRRVNMVFIHKAVADANGY